MLFKVINQSLINNYRRSIVCVIISYWIKTALKNIMNTIENLNAFASRYFQLNLRKSTATIEYLKSRGLSGRTALRFNLGYSTFDKSGLDNQLKDFDQKLVAQSGLVYINQKERKRFDMFRGRVMFPIRGIDGAVLGFGGRILDGSSPKYLNSSESVHFKKRELLYGIFESHAEIRRKNQAIVVEGYMDVAMLSQYEYGNAVSPLGTAVTAQQIELLLEHTDNVVFCFDGDEAGKQASTNALMTCLSYSSKCAFKFSSLAPGDDPDSFIRENGKGAFDSIIDKSATLEEALHTFLLSGTSLDSAEGRAGFLFKAKPIWSKIACQKTKSKIFHFCYVMAGMEGGELSNLWGGNE